MPYPREGTLFVVSAPSGAGKTSLCKELIDFFPDLGQSISFTTRSPRNGEADGRDYHFVTAGRFEEMIGRNQFAEWAEVHGNRYGTALATLDEARAAGRDLLLDIDCQGARQLRDSVRQAVFVFILPPGLEVLEERLRGRRTDSEETIRRRLQNARAEIEQAAWYDYSVVNDSFATALNQLKSIIIAERCRTSRLQKTSADLLGS